MAKKGQSNEKASISCRDCGHWDEVREKIRIHELVERTVQQFEAKISKKAYEPSVAEYVKLLQLEREIGQDAEPKEIKVTWVDPHGTSKSEK